jgi:hypothetical protein
MNVLDRLGLLEKISSIFFPVNQPEMKVEDNPSPSLDEGSGTPEPNSDLLSSIGSPTSSGSYLSPHEGTPPSGTSTLTSSIGSPLSVKIEEIYTSKVKKNEQNNDSDSDNNSSDDDKNYNYNAKRMKFAEKIEWFIESNNINNNNYTNYAKRIIETAKIKRPTAPEDNNNNNNYADYTRKIIETAKIERPTAPEDNNNNNIYNFSGRKRPIYPDEISALADQIIQALQETARSEKDHQKKMAAMNLYRGFLKALAKAELHVHLEGFFNTQHFLEFLKDGSENIFYDEKKERFRSTAKMTRIPGHKVSIEKLKELLIVDLTGGKSTDEELADQFKKIFKCRGDILDRVSFSRQIATVMKDAEIHNVIYRELMFGIYDVPIPKAFIKEVEDYVNNNYKKIIEANKLAGWQNLLLKKALKEYLTEEEKDKFKRKIIKRFGSEEGLWLYKKMISQSYCKAFNTHLETVINKTRKEVKNFINAENKKKEDKKERPVLDPDIFSAKSSHTLKLIFEIMRHYELGKFFAWALASFAYISQKRTDEIDTPVIGVTIDGPEDDENSNKNFDYQIVILQLLKSMYQDVPITFHALEFSNEEFVKGIARYKDRLFKVLKVADRVSHIPNYDKGSDFFTTTARLQNVGVELCISSIPVTTGIPIDQIPFRLLNRGAPVFSPSTDDPGCIKKKDGFPDVSKELILADEFFNLDFTLHVETMKRNDLEYSFLQEKTGSIYLHNRVIPTANPNVLTRKYVIKDIFKDVSEMSDQMFYEVIAKYNPKQQKQCQLERKLYKFKEYLVKNKDMLYEAGYLSFKC